MVLAMVPVRVFADDPETFTELQFDIVGIQLQIDPLALTVPKNIPTQINIERRAFTITFLVVWRSISEKASSHWPWTL